MRQVPKWRERGLNKQACRNNEMCASEKRAREGQGKGCLQAKDAIVFLVFILDVKILIGQIFVSVKILLFGGVTD